MKLDQIGFWSEIKLEIIRREKDGYDAADRSWRLRFQGGREKGIFKHVKMIIISGKEG